MSGLSFRTSTTSRPKARASDARWPSSSPRRDLPVSHGRIATLAANRSGDGDIATLLDPSVARGALPGRTAGEAGHLLKLGGRSAPPVRRSGHAADGLL